MDDPQVVGGTAVATPTPPAKAAPTGVNAPDGSKLQVVTATDVSGTKVQRSGRQKLNDYLQQLEDDNQITPAERSKLQTQLGKGFAGTGPEAEAKLAALVPAEGATGYTPAFQKALTAVKAPTPTQTVGYQVDQITQSAAAKYAMTPTEMRAFQSQVYDVLGKASPADQQQRLEEMKGQGAFDDIAMSAGRNQARSDFKDAFQPVIDGLRSQQALAVGTYEKARWQSIIDNVNASAPQEEATFLQWRQARLQSITQQGMDASKEFGQDISMNDAAMAFKMGSASQYLGSRGPAMIAAAAPDSVVTPDIRRAAQAAAGITIGQVEDNANANISAASRISAQIQAHISALQAASRDTTKMSPEHAAGLKALADALTKQAPDLIAGFISSGEAAAGTSADDYLNVHASPFLRAAAAGTDLASLPLPAGDVMGIVQAAIGTPTAKDTAKATNDARQAKLKMVTAANGYGPEQVQAAADEMAGKPASTWTGHDRITGLPTTDVVAQTPQGGIHPDIRKAYGALPHGTAHPTLDQYSQQVAQEAAQLPADAGGAAARTGAPRGGQAVYAPGDKAMLEEYNRKDAITNVNQRLAGANNPDVMSGLAQLAPKPEATFQSRTEPGFHSTANGGMATGAFEPIPVKAQALADLKRLTPTAEMTAQQNYDLSKGGTPGHPAGSTGPNDLNRGPGIPSASTAAPPPPANAGITPEQQKAIDDEEERKRQAAAGTASPTGGGPGGVPTANNGGEGPGANPT